MSVVFGPYGNVNAGDYYGRGLGHVLRGYRLWDIDWALSKDPEVYERLRRDPVVAFAMRYRKLLAAGSDWYLEPAGSTDEDRLLAKILEELLKGVEYFTMARYNLAEAIIAGSRWGKLEGELRRIPIADMEPMEWWVCTHIMDVDKRRFKQLPLDEPTGVVEVSYPGPPGVLTPGEASEVHREWVWQIYRPLQQRWETFEREDFIRHVHDDREDALGYGSGLASELYMYWYAKEVVLQQGLQYLERWSQGIILAGVNTLRDGLASSPPSSQRMSDWLSVLNQMRSRHVLVHDSQDKFDVKDAPQQGWRAALEALEYLDGALRVAILGAALPTSQKVDGGSYALAEVQERTTETLNKFDHACLEDSVRRDLLGWLVRKNRATLVSLGLEDRILPYFRLRSSHSDDHGERADILLKARQAGLDIRIDEAYAQLGFSMPTHQDEILTPLSQQESLNQGGDGGEGEGGEEGDVLGQDGKKGTPRNEREKNNPLRPDHKGGKPPLREKAIDKATSGFGRPTRPEGKFAPDGVLHYAGSDKDMPAPNQLVVNMPRQEPPVVQVHLPQAPDLHVHVPRQPAPVIHVDAAPAPVVNVQVEPKIILPPEAIPQVVVQLPPPGKKTVQVERNRDGTIASLEIKPADPASGSN